MKKMKKALAVILSLAMVLGMSLTAFADDHVSNNANGSSNDSVEVSISGLTGDPAPQVTLYRIAKGKYQGTGANSFVKYEWATGITPDTIKKAEDGQLSASDVMNIVNGIKNINNAPQVTPITDNGIVIPSKIENGTYSATVKAGAYIAVISGGGDGAVYNPILLTASYDKNGKFVGGNILASKDTMYGSGAIAKKTEPVVDKDLVDGTTKDENSEGEEIDTASVGDVVDYKVSLTPPAYPSNAVNKTLFVTDTMTEGLTYDSSSLTIKFNGKELKANEEGVFLDETTEVAKVVTEGNTFYLNFDYDTICDEDGVPYNPLTVEYSARVNENAVVGIPGNKNHVYMYYANNPTTGTTFKPTDDKKTPEGAEGVTYKDKEEILYTYQISFKKNDEQGKALPGAIFGIYKDNEGKVGDLVDIVETNDAGYAVSTSIAKGTYWVREIKAPEGYSLNDKAYKVEANWVEATKTIFRKKTTVKYTDNPDEAATQPAVSVGWILDGTFYKNQPSSDKAVPAYVKEMTTTEGTTTETVVNPEINGTVELGEAIPNTKLSSLPSTGGIGTTIFTIGGCAIMIIAAALFFASRRRAVK